ncbi:MAG: hypothetical protein Q9P44_21305 [Anaerolineae bacterium]|nr:hypothetical protein [Anaerolineae bacterium]
MSDQDSSPMETAALALYYHAAQMIKAGQSHADIKKELISKGINPETAENMLVKLNRSRTNVMRQTGYRNAFAGVVLIAMALLPIFGIFAPTAVGTSLTIALAIIGCGVFALGRGLMQIIGL